MTVVKANLDDNTAKCSWQADCVLVGTLEEVLASLREFTKNIELAASENPGKLIGIDCRAGTQGLVKVRTLNKGFPIE